MNRWKKSIAQGVKKYNLKSTKYHIFDKTLLLFSICKKCGSEDEQIFKEEKPIEISKILGLNNM